VLALPEKCKAPMYLHYYEGYTCKEIGEILGCKESAIKMRLKKGRELLKIDLEQEVLSWN
jgi:RNA polymerase sigma-70 factor (ECF subfamily)